MEIIIVLFKVSVLIIISIGVYSFFSVSEEDMEFLREQKRISKHTKEGHSEHPLHLPAPSKLKDE